MDIQGAPPATGRMEGSGGSPTTMAKRLWHIVRIVYYMLRKGLSKRKLMMELHLLLKRGKIAGKAIGNLMFHHHHHDTHHHYSSTGGGGGGYYAAFSCRSMDPNLSYYNPREVEFSCSNTPSYPFQLNRRKQRHHRYNFSYDYDVATVRKALEIINSQVVPESPDVATPFWSFGKSPMVGARQLRITDSPFPVEEADADPQVDREAEEFIQRFYEQLRNQQYYRRQAVHA